MPEGTALRNIEHILTGEAKSYYRCKRTGESGSFRCCEDVRRFTPDLFLGQEMKEVTLEHLYSLSMHEKAEETRSIVTGLMGIRDEIVKLVKLVLAHHQNEMEQKRWLEKAVRMYKWPIQRPPEHTR